MIFSILGILCVIGGFVVKFFGKKLIVGNGNLRYGIIKEIEEQEDGYCVSLEYTKDFNTYPEIIQIYTKRKPRKTEIILEEKLDGFAIYNGRRNVLLTSLILWIVGAILCTIG